MTLLETWLSLVLCIFCDAYVFVKRRNCSFVQKLYVNAYNKPSCVRQNTPIFFFVKWPLYLMHYLIPPGDSRFGWGWIGGVGHLLKFRNDEVVRTNWSFPLSLLPTAREGNVFTGICHSVQNCPHGYLVTAHPCYSTVGTHPTGMLSCLQ